MTSSLGRMSLGLPSVNTRRTSSWAMRPSGLSLSSRRIRSSAATAASSPASACRSSGQSVKQPSNATNQSATLEVVCSSTGKIE